ncbi:hypothetical protein [Candidatus Ferrigenium straubiae]|jgi:hypothetical protein|uniref:hypothetical protein n=1 Tax=Candidatus Ferrigenium straubiae TaxID=2919506 RepID=UPI003F4AC1EA
MDKEAFEERAAILEFDAGMPRAMAEARARQPVACAVRTARSAPPPLPQEDRQTPGYMEFRDKWHSRTRKLF